MSGFDIRLQNRSFFSQIRIMLFVSEPGVKLGTSPYCALHAHCHVVTCAANHKVFIKQLAVILGCALTTLRIKELGGESCRAQSNLNLVHFLGRGLESENCQGDG